MIGSRGRRAERYSICPASCRKIAEESLGSKEANQSRKRDIAHPLRMIADPLVSPYEDSGLEMSSNAGIGNQPHQTEPHHQHPYHLQQSTESSHHGDSHSP